MRYTLAKLWIQEESCGYRKKDRDEFIVIVSLENNKVEC